MTCMTVRGAARSKATAVAVLTAFFLSTWPGRARAQTTLLMQAPPVTAFVLDGAGKSLTALDTATAKERGRVALEGEPETLLRSKDGSRLLVLDRGPGKFTVRFGYHPSGKSVVTIVDSSSMAVAARFDLGWGLGPAHLTADGQYLVVLCPGYRSQKAEETLPGEVVVVDVRAGRVSGRVAVERAVETLLLSKDGRLAMVFSPRVAGDKSTKPLSAEVRFVDVANAALVSTLAIDGSPGGATLSPDGAYVYLLDVGTPSKKPEKNINGRLHAVSLGTRAIEARLNVGTQPRGLVVDDQTSQLLILSDGAINKETKKSTGELRVIRGATLAATVTVAPNPLFLRLAPDREWLHVVSTGALTTVDYVSMKDAGSILLDTAGIGIGAGLALFDPKHVSELAITPDGKRGVALYDRSSRLLVLDFEAHKVVTSVATGRSGVKLGKFMGAVAATALSAYAGQSLAGATGAPYYTYSVYGVAAANTSIALRPDGKFVYALNTQTNDVTIVNVETGEVVDKISGGGRRLQLMTGGAVVTAVGGSLSSIDTVTHQALPDLAIEGQVLDLSLSPDGRYAIALADKTVVCLDGSTGKRLASANGFKHPAQVVFDEGEDEVAAITNTPTAPPISPTVVQPVVPSSAPPATSEPRPSPPPERPSTEPASSDVLRLGGAQTDAEGRDALEAGNRLENAGDLAAALQQYERVRQVDPFLASIADQSSQRVRARMKTEGADALRRARQYDALNRVAEAITWYERADRSLANEDPEKKVVKDRLDVLRAKRR